MESFVQGIGTATPTEIRRATRHLLPAEADWPSLPWPDADTYRATSLFAGVAEAEDIPTLCELLRAGYFIHGQAWKVKPLLRALERLDDCGHSVPFFGFSEAWFAGREGPMKLADVLDTAQGADMAARFVDLVSKDDVPALLVRLGALRLDARVHLLSVCSFSRHQSLLRAALFAAYEAWCSQGPGDPPVDIDDAVARQGNLLAQERCAASWRKAYATATEGERDELVSMLPESAGCLAPVSADSSIEQRRLRLHMGDGRSARSRWGADTHRRAVLDTLRRDRSALLLSLFADPCEPRDDSAVERALSQLAGLPEDASWIGRVLDLAIWSPRASSRLAQIFFDSDRQRAIEWAARNACDTRAQNGVRAILFRIAGSPDPADADFLRGCLVHTDDAFVQYMALDALDHLARRATPGVDERVFRSAFGSMHSSVRLRAAGALAWRDRSWERWLVDEAAKADSPIAAALVLHALAETRDPGAHVDLFLAAIRWREPRRPCAGASCALGPTVVDPSTACHAFARAHAWPDDIHHETASELPLFEAGVYGLVTARAGGRHGLVEAWRRAVFDGFSIRDIERHLRGANPEERHSPMFRDPRYRGREPLRVAERWRLLAA